MLEAIVMQTVLDDHYEHYPNVRPSLGDLAVAATELDGHPLAAEPGRLRQAADEVTRNHPDASPDDVLLWAEAWGPPSGMSRTVVLTTRPPKPSMAQRT